MTNRPDRMVLLLGSVGPVKVFTEAIGIPGVLLRHTSSTDVPITGITTDCYLSVEDAQRIGELLVAAAKWRRVGPPVTLTVEPLPEPDPPPCLVLRVAREASRSPQHDMVTERPPCPGHPGLIGACCGRAGWHQEVRSAAVPRYECPKKCPCHD